MQNLLVEIYRLDVNRLARGALAPLGDRLVHPLVPPNLLGLESRLVRLQHRVRRCFSIVNVEIVVVRSREDVSGPVSLAQGREKDGLSVSGKRALELVEDAIVLVQIAQLAPQMVVHVDRLDRTRLHVDIPDSQREVVAREDVSPVF